MRKSVILGTVVLFGSGGLFGLSRHGLAELVGFARASADVTVDGVTNQLPSEVHDRKLDHQLAQARQDVIDRQVQLTLSRNHLDQLRTDVQNLSTSIERRQRLLAEAYPILDAAAKEQKNTVRFASQELSIREFQTQIDDLLVSQDREERQLAIKSQGLDRLEKGAKEGEQAIAEMRTAMETAEQEVAVLRSRRSQAEMESQTLDMVTSVTRGRSDVTTTVAKSLESLKGGVERLEAHNDARRSHATPVQAAGRNELTAGWTRLEALKAIHDKVGVN